MQSQKRTAPAVPRVCFPLATAAAVNATHVVMAAPLPASVLPGDALTSISWMPSFTAFNNVYRNNRARWVWMSARRKHGTWQRGGLITGYCCRRCQLIKTHNVNVYNNVYEGCSGVGVQVCARIRRCLCR